MRYVTQIMGQENRPLVSQNFSYDIYFAKEEQTVLYFSGFNLCAKKVIVDYAIVTVSDKYDFGEKSWDSLGNVLNNLAALAHNNWGVGRDYEWKANFKVYLPLLAVF